MQARGCEGEEGRGGQSEKVEEDCGGGSEGGDEGDGDAVSEVGEQGGVSEILGAVVREEVGGDGDGGVFDVEGPLRYVRGGC